jgi:hypothetical protein
MTITIQPTALKAVLNNANPNIVPSMLQAMNFGDFVRSTIFPMYGALPLAAAVDPYVVAAAQAIQLPDDGKAQTILLAYARAGSGTPGVLTVDAGGDSNAVNTAPAASHVAVSANGDLLFNASDAWTSVDLIIQPWKYLVFEVTMSTTAANTITLPAADGLVLFLLEVQATVGTSTGAKIIDKPGTAPAAGHAALNTAKTAVSFQASDAVTAARVKFAVIPTTDLNAALTAVSNLIS